MTGRWRVLVVVLSLVTWVACGGRENGKAHVPVPTGIPRITPSPTPLISAPPPSPSPSPTCGDDDEHHRHPCGDGE
jgi:hypothetical protein